MAEGGRATSACVREARGCAFQPAVHNFRRRMKQWQRVSCTDLTRGEDRGQELRPLREKGRSGERRNSEAQPAERGAARAKGELMDGDAERIN